jgi:hypothetical protein
MEDLGSVRFCASCQKCVTDFTQLSDSEIARIIESQEGELCGRFNADQLDRALMLNDSKQNKYLTTLFSMSLASIIGFQNEVQAKPMLPIRMANVAKDSLSPASNRTQTPQNRSEDSILIHGIVQDSLTGEPLVGVTIFLRKEAVATNVEGKFEWRISKKKFYKNTHLQVAFTGYELKTIPISMIDVNKSITVLLNGGTVLGGLVVEPRYSFKQKMRRFFRKIF